MRKLLFILCLILTMGAASADYTGTTYYNGSASYNDTVDLGYTSYINSIEVDITNNAPIAVLNNSDIMTKAKLINLTVPGVVNLINVSYDADMQNNFSDLRIITPNSTIVDIMHGDEVNGSYSNIYFNATEDTDYYLVYGNATATRLNTTVEGAGGDDEVLFDGTDHGTSSLTYVLFYTMEYPAAAYGYDLYQVKSHFDVTGGGSAQTLSCKVTCSIDGGEEQTLNEESWSQDYNDEYVKEFDVEAHADSGENMTVYLYAKIGYNSYSVWTRDCYTYAAKTVAVSTLYDEFDLEESYTIGLNATGDSDSDTFVYNQTKTVTINPTGLITEFNLTSDSIDYYYDAEVNYNWTIPDPTNVVLVPDVDNVADGTLYEVNIYWEDTDLKNASLYVDYGAGYVLEDSKNFTGTAEWANFTINTTGYTGTTIQWYETAFNDAKHSYTYNDSFNVILDELSIYVFDESTGDSILPEQVRIYNETAGYYATINETTNVSILDYDYVDSGKYVVSVVKDGYYSRNSIIDVDITTLSELNIYLPSENETVIYDKFVLVDYTREYDYDEYIMRLDKPIGNSTETVYASYFDFAGSTSTYLIAADQYILYIITPETTITYGWLSPDVDGEVSIILSGFDFSDIEDWLQYTYTESDTSVSFDYTSSKSVASAYMAVTKDGSEVYNVSASTDTGSFTYVFTENGTYYISCMVIADDGTQFIKGSVREVGGSTTFDPFPESYDIVVKSLIIMFFEVLGILGISSYRSDLAGIYGASLYAVAVFNDWCYGDILTVTIVGIIAVAAIVKFQKKNNRSTI